MTNSGIQLSGMPLAIFLQEMIVRPNAEMRGVIRDELCCSELNMARAEVLQFIKSIRK